jgi:molybdopterin-guanine dinucleotide biosynthesis protein A
MTLASCSRPDQCRPSVADEPVAAVLLAGGRASRLGGTDKPGITIGGRSLLETVAAAAADAGASRIIIVGPARAGFAAGHLEFTSEQPPGAGPVPALRAGIARVTEPWLLLLAADLPFLRGPHLIALLTTAARRQRAGAVLVDGEGRKQWLVSCWQSGPLRSALDKYGGASLGGVLGPLGPAEVIITREPGEPAPWLDCDTDEDLAAALAFAYPGKDDTR